MSAASFSPDASKVLVSLYDGSADLYERSSGERICSCAAWPMQATVTRTAECNKSISGPPARSDIHVCSSFTIPHDLTVYNCERCALPASAKPSAQRLWFDCKQQSWSNGDSGMDRFWRRAGGLRLALEGLLGCALLGWLLVGLGLRRVSDTGLLGWALRLLASRRSCFRPSASGMFGFFLPHGFQKLLLLPHCTGTKAFCAIGAGIVWG